MIIFVIFNKLSSLRISPAINKNPFFHLSFNLPNIPFFHLSPLLLLSHFS